MTFKQWILTDVARDVYEQELTVTASDVGGPAQGYQISKRRLRGGLSDGVDTIRVDNGRLAFEVLPTRGMNLWQAWLGDTPLGWRSPIRGPVHPAYVPLAEPSGLGWLDGFDELLARCGLESNGAPEFDEQGRLRYGLHGRISNRPAQHVELCVDGQTGEISVIGEVEESRFLFTKLRLISRVRTWAGATALWIEDQIENFGGTSVSAQLLYHINIGPPWLSQDAQLVAPVKTVVPRNARAAAGIQSWNRFSGATVGFEEQVYFLELFHSPDQQSHVLLHTADRQRGLSLMIDAATLPCFTLWKNTAAANDGYVAGLEPATNYPNPRTFEQQQGRVVHLAPGQRQTFRLQLEIHPDADSVQRAADAVARLQHGTQPVVHHQPQAGWTPP